jgi:hypothetical protein
MGVFGSVLKYCFAGIPFLTLIMHYIIQVKSVNMAFPFLEDATYCIYHLFPLVVDMHKTQSNHP